MNNIKDDKQKKMLLILPLLAIPFATMFFWALGGGKAAHAQVATAQLQGLNMKLPGAQLKKDSSENKLAFYEQAEKDSLKFKQLRKDDPYYKADTTNSTIKKDSLNRFDTGTIPKMEGGLIGKNFSTHSFSNSSANLAASEQQINAKLAALNKQINQPVTNEQQQTGNTGFPPNQSDTGLSHMQVAIQKMGSSDASDPEMQQLSGMLDKIQEIQNPAIARQKLKAQSEKERGTVLPVSNSGNTGDQTVMKGTGDGLGDNTSYLNFSGQNGFYDLDQTNEDVIGNAITAVVHQTQTLTAGSTIKLRLLQDIYINGRLIPKDNFVFGTCSLEGERLAVDIKTIRYRASVFPVAMRVFDEDGLSGIYVPGAITRDAVKEGTDEAIQSYDPMSYDPSLGAQAATAGIAMAKGLFSKKVKLIKVTVKAGYAVLLLNANQLNK